MPLDDPTANLAFRNLTRARMVRAGDRPADGRTPAEQRRAGHDADAAPDQPGQQRRRRSTTSRSAQATARADQDTPLFFYILREAELNGGKLAGVGARIVAETFHRAMEGSQPSIVRNPTWRPIVRARQRRRSG